MKRPSQAKLCDVRMWGILRVPLFSSLPIYTALNLAISAPPLISIASIAHNLNPLLIVVLTSLGGGPVDTVLGTVSLDELVVAGVTAHGEGHLQDVVAALHQHEDSLDLALLLVLGQLALHLLDQLVLGHL